MKIVHRKLFYSAVILTCIVIYSCTGRNGSEGGSGDQNNGGYPEMKFDTIFHDFGTLMQGEKASFIFKFTNTGNADLVIKDAYSTCGCTVPDYSKKPLSPGEEGKLEVVFNSAGKIGKQYKTVKIILNTKNKEETLTIQANVITE